MCSSTQIMINDNIVQRFRRLCEVERLAHAYLLVGPDGSGKIATALAAAKIVNCENLGESFCGQCSSCLKIDGGNHPDITFVDQGEEKSIKIHKVRELIQKIQLRPYEAQKKVVIIKDADLLTMEGANALLKTLEEPSASSLLLLTTANPERILGTIRSRCHVMTFYGLSKQKLSSQLKQDVRLSEREAQVISGFSEGCYGKALRLADGNFIDDKNGLIDKFLFQGVDEATLKSMQADHQLTKKTLDILLFCIKDMLLVKAGAPQDHLANGDRAKDLTACAARFSLKQLKDALAEVVNTKKLLDAGLNVKVPLMLLKEKLWISN